MTEDGIPFRVTVVGILDSEDSVQDDGGWDSVQDDGGMGFRLG